MDGLLSRLRGLRMRGGDDGVTGGAGPTAAVLAWLISMLSV